MSQKICIAPVHPKKERRILIHTTTTLKTFEQSGPRYHPLSPVLFTALTQRPRSAKAIHRRHPPPHKNSAKVTAMASYSSFAILKGSSSFHALRITVHLFHISVLFDGSALCPPHHLPTPITPLLIQSTLPHFLPPYLYGMLPPPLSSTRHAHNDCPQKGRYSSHHH